MVLITYLLQLMLNNIEKMSELEEGHLPIPKCNDEIMTEEEREERA